MTAPERILATVQPARDGWYQNISHKDGTKAFGPQWYVRDDLYAALAAEKEALERERDEDQGVIRVWRRRCETAEARISELEAENATLREATDAGHFGRGYQWVREKEARATAAEARIRELEAWIVALDLPGAEAKHGCTRHFSHAELVDARALLARMGGEHDRA